MEELIVSIRTGRPGEVIALDYTRDSSDDQVKVTLGSRVG
jgi:S1-C subfamily serine protease